MKIRSSMKDEISASGNDFTIDQGDGVEGEGQGPHEETLERGQEILGFLPVFLHVIQIDPCAEVFVFSCGR